MSATASRSIGRARAWPPEPRKDVAVAGASGELDQLAALLSALESVIPVCFVRANASDPASLAGLVAIGEVGASAAPAGLPRLLLPSRHASREVAAAWQRTPTIVRLSSDAELARPLRGRAIPELLRAGRLPADVSQRARALASVEGRPVWCACGSAGEQAFTSAYALPALGPAESLREHLRAGCFMGLLPLLHFLDSVLGEQRWQPPAARAAFVVDDPNLHWTSYGHLRYHELADHARLHGYHVALATVPLDGWRIDRRAAGLFRERSDSLSLALHGNDHVAKEMGRITARPSAEAMVAQALRRVRGQERRAGICVDRVMVPPHSACSQAALRAMFRLGLDGACINRPYPWRDGLPAATPLAGWHPVELVAGGLAVLPRRRLDESREELVFRALLGQPLVLYGHHGDLAEGLDVLAAGAEEVGRLAAARWESLGAIASGCCATRRVGDTLLVRMYARRSAIAVPDGVRALQVQLPAPFEGAAWHRLAHPDGAAEVELQGEWGLSAPIPCEPRTEVALAIVPDSPLSPTTVPSPRRRMWPLMRRLASEGRDRAQPLLARPAHPARPKAAEPPDRSVHGGIASAGRR